MTRRAVVLLSGGLDSTTCLAMAKAAGFEPVCLCVSYGQRHAVEIERARAVAQAFGVADFRVVTLGLRAIGGSALTADLEVPKDRPEGEMSHGIPSTYVPARNTLMLALALGLAEVVGAQDLYIGVNAVDYSGYPDCRPEFIRGFEQLAGLATRAGVEGGKFTVRAPLSGMSKADIIRAGMALGVDYGMTHSCYDPSPEGLACRRCDSCQLRAKGFREAGVADPTRYV
ncbi:MAG: 7-cyano-7-deazaguanine synthase QueC [Deltaproteobacteria bacterium]|nr:7-cyano-7-deazaguanine synthase QueC [Deltaproteobacteria bacterium]